MGREREGEGDKHWCERETLIGCFLYMLLQGTEPATQACTMTWNWTGDPSSLQNTHPVSYWPGLCIWLLVFCFFFWRFYLFISREGKGGRKRGRETLMCGCISHVPHWGPGPQHRHMPWLGIEPVTPCFARWHSIYWAILARAVYDYWWTVFCHFVLLLEKIIFSFVKHLF